MKNAELFNGCGYCEVWENIIHSYEVTVIDVLDAIEDAKTSTELCENINALNLIYKFHIDRETDRYVRLLSVDPLGNRKYIKAYK